jgi:hypothetical protein
MSFGTIVPDMVLGFAEAVTQAIEAGEQSEWSVEDVRQITLASRETREKIVVLDDMVRNQLKNGVDAATFAKQAEGLLVRLDKCLLQHSVVLAGMDRFQTTAPEMVELIAAFEELGKGASRHRDLLKEAVSKIRTPRRPIDWQQVQEVQAAFARGETASLAGTPRPGSD